MSHKKVYENKYFCNVVIPSENTKILEFKQFHKSDKTPLTFSADFKSLIERLMNVKIFLINNLQQK